MHWVYFCATPLENWNDAPWRRDAQFENPEPTLSFKIILSVIMTIPKFWVL